MQSLKTEFLTSEQRVIFLLFSIIKIMSSSGAKIIQATVHYKSMHSIRSEISPVMYPMEEKNNNPSTLPVS